MKNDGISTIYNSDKILHKVGSRKGKTKAEIAKREDSIKASVKKGKKGNFVQVGEGRLKPNSNSTKLSPTHLGSLKLDVEQLQNLLNHSNDKSIYLPISAWIKDSQFDDRQYIDIRTSQFIKK